MLTPQPVSGWHYVEQGQVRLITGALRVAPVPLRKEAQRI